VRLGLTDEEARMLGLEEVRKAAMEKQP